MDLTDEDIREFIAIWKKECGEELTPGQVWVEANRLLDLYLFLAEGEMKSRKTNEAA